MNNVLFDGILLLEGEDGQKYQEHSNKCTPCHLHIRGTLQQELVIVPQGLSCFICGEKKEAATMLLCDQCPRGWHMAYLIPSLSSLLSRD